MPDKKPDQYQTIAAQLWCLPQHGSKEMDCEFAQSIADALEKCAQEARRDAFLEAAALMRDSIKPCSPEYWAHIFEREAHAAEVERLRG